MVLALQPDLDCEWGAGERASQSSYADPEALWYDPEKRVKHYCLIMLHEWRSFAPNLVLDFLQAGRW